MAAGRGLGQLRARAQRLGARPLQKVERGLPALLRLTPPQQGVIGVRLAIAELRYNDVSGLRALGIDIDPLPSAAEIDTRETADPFPGDAHFARPVR